MAKTNKKKTKPSKKKTNSRRYVRGSDGETLRATLIALVIILVFVLALAGIVKLCGGFGGDEGGASNAPALAEGTVSVHFIERPYPRFVRLVADCAQRAVGDSATARILRLLRVDRLRRLPVEHAHIQQPRSVSPRNVFSS